ncbi:MAG: phosphodiester glycosidase family protein [Actinomycetes bacterium]
MTTIGPEPSADNTPALDAPEFSGGTATVVADRDGIQTGNGKSEKPKRRKLRKRFPKTFRVILAILALILVVFLWAGFSFFQAVRSSEGEPLEVVAATWARDHNLGPVVAVAEDLYYKYINTTPEGGDPTESFTIDDNGNSTNKGKNAPVVDHLTPPATLVSPAGTPKAGEGVWQPTKATVQGEPAVYVARVRPDNVHTSVLISLMWVDTKLAKFALVPGYEEPGGPSPTDGAMPKALQATALASWNGGFRLQDSNGGYFYDGKMISPLQNGRASAVFYKDGSLKIGKWGSSDLVMGPQVQTVRQNLDLIVDNGKAQTYSTDSGSRWGATTDGASLAWRSAVGQRKDGSIVYVGSPGMSADALADAMVNAGVQRAMTLDMNNWWVAGFYYQQTANGLKCSKLDPAIQEGCDRFLNRYKRDSFAVYGKTS